MTDHLQGHGAVQLRRPSSALVFEIGQRLSETVDTVSQSALVAAIQRRRGARVRRPPLRWEIS
jgi:hypothetical protein